MCDLRYNNMQLFEITQIQELFFKKVMVCLNKK